MKKILGVVPARGGSKGVPRKNLKPLGGFPLLQHIIRTAEQSKYINRLILSTEDDEIAEAGKEIGIEVPFKRPAELATDNATGIAVIKHALKHFDSMGERFDGVISLQATNPLMKTETIDRAIALWLETGCDSVTAVAQLTKGHPYITKRLSDNGRIENFCEIPANAKMHRRQAREKVYYLTGALYLRSRELIEAENMDSHYLGLDSRAIVVSELESIDIDTPFDFELAEILYNKLRNQL
jgi:CMP-N,N'-diacetyllegionaminic acid synthase